MVSDATNFTGMLLLAQSDWNESPDISCMDW